MKNRIALLVLVCSSHACQVPEQELIGTYTIHGQVNTRDTLRLLENGTYRRSLYNHQTSALIFQHQNRWEAYEGRVTLYDYLLDEDQIYRPQVKNFDHVLITSSLPVQKWCGKTRIYHRMDTDNFYYEKLGPGANRTHATSPE